jgi:hypothetical protein
MRISPRIKDEYEILLKEEGADRFYFHILNNGFVAKYNHKNPEVMMLNQSDSFFSLFRTTGNINFFTIGVLLRKAAHKLYRDFRRKKTAPINRRFLQIVE